MLTIGIDSGTQSTKCVVLDVESGAIVASTHAAHALIDGLPPGHMEQHPRDWAAAMDATVSDCLRQIGNRRAEVAAIGVSGQQHGLVVLDKQDRVVRPAKLWCDTSTAPQCRRFEETFGGPEGLIELAGNTMLPGYTAPKILWLKQNEPVNYAAAVSFLLPHDYLNFVLTGEKSMEYGDASGTGLLNIRSRRWCVPFLDFIDPGLSDALPVPRRSSKPAGTVRKELLEKWGLGREVIVSAGGGDNMMGAIGTGNTRPGVVTVSLGTSGTLYSYSDKPVIDRNGEIAAFCDSTDAWLPLVCTMNVTVATEQIRNLLGWTHAQLDAAWRATVPGADGILFLPYLNGERTPNLPDGCGVFHGLKTTNMTAENMARAVVDGVTLGLAYGLQRFRGMGIEPREIRLTGGGSKNAAWRAICADAFRAPVVCLKSAEGAALGAALQAAWAASEEPGSQARLRELADRLVATDEETRVEPDPAREAAYAGLLEKHVALSRRLNEE